MNNRIADTYDKQAFEDNIRDFFSESKDQVWSYKFSNPEAYSKCLKALEGGDLFNVVYSTVDASSGGYSNNDEIYVVYMWVNLD